MSGVFIRLRRALAGDRELSSLQHLQKLGDLRTDSASDEADLCTGGAHVFNHTYTALENIFKRIATVFEGVPIGEHWHRELLDRMFEETEIRPAVLSRGRSRWVERVVSISTLLDSRLRRCPLREGERLSSLRDTVVGIAKMLEADINRFDDYLSKLIDDPSQT